MWDRFKVRLLLVAAVATLASACTESGNDTEGTQAARELMESALGTQAVQDFVAVLDLSLVTGDEAVSITDKLMDRARADGGRPVDLRGEFTFTPVNNLDAWATDRTGQAIPTVSVDFGLLELDESGQRAVQDLAVQSVEPDRADADPIDFASGFYDGSLLIQIVTASYRGAWSHVGLEDSVTIDLSTFGDVGETDELVLVHVFGQTLPGDPAVEAGMSAHELFAYRWNQGLVRLVGGADGPQIILAGGAMSGEQVLSGEAPPTLLAAGILGPDPGLALAVEQELPGPDQGSTEPGDDGVPSTTARLMAKTFERTLYTTQAYLEGEAKAVQVYRDHVSKITTRTTPDSPIQSERVGGPVPHCIVAKYPDIYVGTNTGGNVPGGCMPMLQMPTRAYGVFLGLLYQHKACQWYTAHARLANNPSRNLQGATEANVNTSTTDPLLDTTTTFPDLPPCDPPRPATAGGGTVGDVHMITFDGLMFDNQAAGEFLLYDDGQVEVQMRTEPWPLSDVASVVTAAAVGVGDARVSMHEGGATFVGGAQVTLERGTPVEFGGGSLLWTGVGWVVVGPNGTELHVADNLDVNGTMHIIIHPKGDEPTGMLGRVNGDKSDDLVTRGGDVYPELEVGDTERFYSSFIDSWRITEDESLFHYGDGESTAGFQREDFPARWIDFGDLDQVAKGDAEAVCREGGVTRPDLLAACIYDIVVTGDPGFAYDAFVFQESLPVPPPPASPTPPASGDNHFTVGGETYEFEGFGSPGWCTADEYSFGAAATFDSGGRRAEMSIQYVIGDPPVLRVVLIRDGRDHAWVNTLLAPPSGTVDELTLQGAQLTASGTAFLNEPFDMALDPVLPLPDRAALVPFTLSVRCD